MLRGGARERFTETKFEELTARLASKGAPDCLRERAAAVYAFLEWKEAMTLR
jgi:hypothetical protein